MTMQSTTQLTTKLETMAKRQKAFSQISIDEFKKQTEALSNNANKEIKKGIDDKRHLKLENLINRACVPNRFRAKNFDNYKSENKEQERAANVCQRYADNFLEVKRKGVCLVLTGKAGTGKTHLAVSVLNQLLVDGHTGLFITVSEMLRAIRGTYSPASTKTEQDIFDEFIKTELLVLDEVGVAIGDDEKRKALIFDVINGRYNQMKPTIILGNLIPNEMEEYLGFRVWDRLQESQAPVIAFDWDSYRRK